MPARVTYWTGTWDPDKEAISKEVNSLRVGHRKTAPVVAFSSGQRTGVRIGQRAIVLSSRQWLALRGLATVVEPWGDVTHIFGGRHSWHHLRALGRRPMILTAVAPAPPAGSLSVGRLARVVIETESAENEWLLAGVPRERIHLIRPGIDVDWFAAGPPSAERFTLLFASTPADPAEIEPRGIGLLVDLARLRPQMDILLPWRVWGDVPAALRAVEALKPPQNFHVLPGDVKDMRSFYSTAHATVVCFDAGVGKTCPNFVVEGLAAGRPCLSAGTVGIAGLIGRSGAGVVSEREVRSLAAGADALQAAWHSHSDRARSLAVECFDLAAFRRNYDRLYEEVATLPASSFSSSDRGEKSGGRETR